MSDAEDADIKAVHAKKRIPLWKSVILMSLKDHPNQKTAKNASRHTLKRLGKRF